MHNATSYEGHNNSHGNISSVSLHCMLQQETQLSQRDRATLRVIEYFAESLKVIRNDTVE